jgi:hypothetical protein
MSAINTQATSSSETIATHSVVRPSVTSAKERLQLYNGRTNKLATRTASQKEEESSSALLIQLLALQVYHLPNNSWCQDWYQYMANNHLIFGICLHHKLHPLKTCTRVVVLIGSSLFGLLLTNVFYMLFLYHENLNQTVATLLLSNGDEWTLTTGMLLLWTVGGGVHATYNLTIWHIAACAFCRPGGCCERAGCCPWFGKRIIRIFVLVMTAFTVLVVFSRVAIQRSAEIEGDDDDIMALDHLNKHEFNFLLGYSVEIFLTMFLYYPIGGIVLFSGMLGCGRLPLLGGRPREVALEKKAEENTMKRSMNRAQPEDVAHRFEPLGSLTDEMDEVELVWMRRSTREQCNADLERAAFPDTAR